MWRGHVTNPCHTSTVCLCSSSSKVQTKKTNKKKTPASEVNTQAQMFVSGQWVDSVSPDSLSHSLGWHHDTVLLTMSQSTHCAEYYTSLSEQSAGCWENKHDDQRLPRLQRWFSFHLNGIRWKLHLLAAEPSNMGWGGLCCLWSCRWPGTLKTSCYYRWERWWREQVYRNWSWCGNAKIELIN